MTLSKRAVGLIALCLAALGLTMLYGDALRTRFLNDDYLLLEEAGTHTLAASLGGLGALGSYYRPLSRQVYFAVLTPIAGGHPGVFHLASFAIFVVALILLALTGPLIWGRLLLQLFAGPILSLDAHLVALVTGSEAAGNMVRFAGQNGRILIGDACSSMHNISLALVLWTTAAVMFRVRVDRGYLGIGALMAAWMFLLNIARLTLIDLRPADYLFLHNGAGAAFFGWTGLIGIAGFSGLGILRAADRQR